MLESWRELLRGWRAWRAVAAGFDEGEDLEEGVVDGEDGAVREMRAGVRHHQLHRVQQRVVVQQQETEIFIALEAGVVKEREGGEVCGVNGEGEIGVDDGALVAGDHKEYEGREGESDLRDVERQTLLGRVGILVADDGHARDACTDCP